MAGNNELTVTQVMDEIMEYFGEENNLKENFPLLHKAIQGYPALQETKNPCAGEDVLQNGTLYGRTDILDVNILEDRSQKTHDLNKEKDAKPLFSLKSDFNYIKPQSAVLLETKILNSQGTRIGGGCYVFESTNEATKTEIIQNLIAEKGSKVTAKATFTSFTVDEKGQVVLSGKKEVGSLHPYVYDEGTEVIKSTELIDPVNKHPNDIFQTYIVYGKRPDKYVSYPYENVPDPILIDGIKYANTWCPFNIKVKLNVGTEEKPTGFTFSKNDPLSDVDFKIKLICVNPKVSEGGGIVFNNSFENIETNLSEKDTCLNIRIPNDWKAFMKVNDLNLVVEVFKFEASFNVNCVIPIAGIETKCMASITAATVVVPGSSAVYVEPLKIRWGCLGEKSYIHTPYGKKPVSVIKEGDHVVAADGSIVRITAVSTGYEEQIINLCAEGSEQILQLTDGHGILTGRGLIPACELTFEDTVMTSEGVCRPITFIERTGYHDTVYNIETEGHAMFLASDIVVTDKEAALSMSTVETPNAEAPSEFMGELKRWAESRNKSAERSLYV